MEHGIKFDSHQTEKENQVQPAERNGLRHPWFAFTLEMLFGPKLLPETSNVANMVKVTYLSHISPLCTYLTLILVKVCKL